jgi:hypothetical protein
MRNFGRRSAFGCPNGHGAHWLCARSGLVRKLLPRRSDPHPRHWSLADTNNARVEVHARTKTTVVTYTFQHTNVTLRRRPVREAALGIVRDFETFAAICPDDTRAHLEPLVVALREYGLALGTGSAESQTQARAARSTSPPPPRLYHRMWSVWAARTGRGCQHGGAGRGAQVTAGGPRFCRAAGRVGGWSTPGVRVL